MEDLIKRSDATEAVYKALRTPPLKGVLTDTMSLAVALVQDIPSADRPQGEWTDREGMRATWDYSAYCSVCGEWSEYLTAYCGNCGARMK